MTVRTMSVKGQEMLDYLPPYYANDAATRTITDVEGLEFQRIEDALTTMLWGAFPSRADDTYNMLSIWETQVGLPVAPNGVTVDTRRARVLGALRRRDAGTGIRWVELISGAFNLSDTEWSHQEGPGPYQVTITLPFTGALNPPANPTATLVAGGTLPTGNHRYRIAARSAYGSTQAVDALPSPIVTTLSHASVALSWTAVSGAVGYDIYRGSTSLLTTTVGTSYTDTGAAPAASRAYPTSNTSGVGDVQAMEDFVRTITPAHLELIFHYIPTFRVGISHVGDVL